MEAQPTIPLSLGPRKTRQRDTILSVIRSAGGPLTLDEIHAQSQERLGQLGIATVYRNLKILRALDAVKVCVFPSGETRFEMHVPSEKHHHHLKCRICHGVFDIHLCPLQTLNGLTLPSGFHIEGHEISYTGLCPGCAR